MLAALSLASGFSGLIYEVLWAKELGLLFGSTGAAQMVVLASFLGGLAAGNWLLGRRADLSNPLRLYGRLECGVAALGLCAPLLFRAGLWAFPARYPIGIAAVVLPTFLMGGTIPALARAAAPAGGESLERAVASIYSWNCAGAVAGALAAGYWLIARFGLDGTAAAAAAVNAACGAAALLSPGLPATTPPKEKKKKAPAPSPLPAALVYEAAFLTGLLSLVYETGWVRLLALVMGSSTYSFSAMLAGFIAGIALGSLLLSRTRLGRLEPAALFGWAQLGLAGVLLATMPFYERLPYLFRIINSAMPRTPGGFYEFEGAKLAFCFALMVPATALIGLTLPLMSRLAVAPDDDGGAVGEGVGLVFAANTAGNVLGALAAYWALPLLGLQAMLRSATTVSAAVGLAVLAFALPGAAFRRWALAAAVLAGLGLYRAAVPPWNRDLLSLGDYRVAGGQVKFTFSEYRAAVLREMKLLFVEDDPQSTITVLGDGKNLRVLKVNGKTEASNAGDMATQVLCAELPLLLRPGVRDALVVGLGSGITAGSALRHRELRKLDIVEISPGVAHAAGFFRAESAPLLDDPRARLHLADAKTFLRGGGGADYDLVISEPSNPWMAGVANLFTTDFYADVRRRLRPGGLMLQWFHLYEMDDENFRLVVRTFAKSFKHVSIWNIHDADVLLLGSDEPVAPDWKTTDAAILDSPVLSDVGRAEVHTVATLLSLQTAGDDAVRRLAGEGPVNTDRRPILEYTAPKAFFKGKFSTAIEGDDDRGTPEGRSRLLLASYLASRRPLSTLEYMDMVMVRHARTEQKALQYFVAAWAKAYPRDPRAALAEYVFYRETGLRAPALAALNRLRRIEPTRRDFKKLEDELPKGT